MAPEMVTELKALLGVVRQRWMGREALVQRLEELEREAPRTEACQFDKAIAWARHGQREQLIAQLEGMCREAGKENTR